MIINFRTDKFSIASPRILLKDFVNPYYNRVTGYETQAVITYTKETLSIDTSSKLFDDQSDDDLYGIQLILTPDVLSRKYYIINEKLPTCRKTISFEYEKDFTQIPLQGVMKNAFKDKNHWYINMDIPYKSFDMNKKNISDNRIGINIIEYRAKNQPEISSWYPICTSYYNDIGTDINGIAKPMANFKVALDLLKDGRLGYLVYDSSDRNTRIQYIEASNIAFEYIDYTRKKIILYDKLLCNELKNVKLQWVNPNKDKLTTDIIKTKQTNNNIEIYFEHPKPLEPGAYELEITIRLADKTLSSILFFDKNDLIHAGSKINKAQIKKGSVQKRPVQAAPASDTVNKLINVIPDRVGICWTGAPNNSYLWPYLLYNWDINDPYVITLKKDGWIAPSQNEFPENNMHTVKNDFNEEVVYPFYKDKNGQEYFITAHVWFKQREYVLKQILDIAKSDPLGAARILYKLAQAYERYVPVYDHVWRNYPLEKRLGPPFPYVGGIWSWWFYMDLTQISGAAEAFDLIRRTDAFDILSMEVGEDVSQKIIEGMFKPSVEFIYTYRVYNSNMDYCIWSGLVSIAKAIDEPDYMHEAYRRLLDYINKTCLFDGFFMEVSLSYHMQSINGVMTVIDKMKGWSDPQGYVSPNTGVRFDNLDLSSLFPLSEIARKAPWLLSYPDKKLLPLQDTWANGKCDGVVNNAEEDDEELSDKSKDRLVTDSELNNSVLMPAAKVLKFIQGQGKKQSQLYMMFSPKYGHNHFDPVNITYYANEQELLPDIGYNYTKYRYWSMSTLAHNTVVVNKKDMKTEGKTTHGGNIDIFAPIDETVQVAKVYQNDAYEETDEYSRELWYIGFSKENSQREYLIDVFRIIGGNCHEYTLNGDANRDSTFNIDKELKEYGPNLLPPGTNFIPPVKALDKGSADDHYYAYGYVRNVKKAVVDDGKYTLRLSTKKDDGTQGVGLKISGFIDFGTHEAYIGQSPSVRQTRLFGVPKDTNDEADKYFMPKFVLRKEGVDLNSTFIHVMEPYTIDEKPAIENIELKNDTIDTKNGDIALKITYGDITDIILSSPNNHKIYFEDITLYGQMGFIRLKNGEVEKMYLIAGALLKKGDIELISSCPIEGKIIRVLRKEAGDAYNAFVTNTIIPNVKDEYFVIIYPDGTTHGYKIEEIITVGSETHIKIRDVDPGFEILDDGSSRMLYYPMKQWKNDHKFKILNIVTKQM